MSMIFIPNGPGHPPRLTMSAEAGSLSIVTA